MECAISPSPHHSRPQATAFASSTNSSAPFASAVDSYIGFVAMVRLAVALENEFGIVELNAAAPLDTATGPFARKQPHFAS